MYAVERIRDIYRYRDRRDCPRGNKREKDFLEKALKIIKYRKRYETYAVAKRFSIKESVDKILDLYYKLLNSKV